MVFKTASRNIESEDLQNSELSCLGMSVGSGYSLRYLRQELARGLGELLTYEGNVEEDFDLTFQVRKHFIIQGQNRSKKNMWEMFYYNGKHSLLWPFPSLLFFLSFSLLSFSSSSSSPC